MLQLAWLRDHMQYNDTLAQWIHEQFAYEYVDQPLVEWQRVFAQGQTNGQWQCLIALEDGQLLGSAALAVDDLPIRPMLGPWLACVFVAPAARQRGLAAQLIAGICDHAKASGITRLYLHTQAQSHYYAKRGWQEVEQFQAWGNTQCLMTREL